MLDGTRRSLMYEGCRVHYVRTGHGALPPLLLVHGGGAHNGWWARVVPHLTTTYDLIVPDLSGHGDSQHRAEYSPTLWARELAAVLAQEDLGAVRYVGHSMGGLLGVVMAAHLPHLVQSLIVVDTLLRAPDGENGSAPRGRGRRPTPVYPSVEAALERFRLRPAGTTAAPRELLDEVGRHALRRLPTGWTWKFDPQASLLFTDEMLDMTLPRVRCPVGIVYGERSEVVGPGTVDYVSSRLGRSVPAIVVRGAYHHVPLDQPETCAQAILRMDAQLTRGTPPLEDDRSVSQR